MQRLAEMQYTRNDMELRRATFRVRGDVIDIYPAESERLAVRIELFGDEVESLARFDPLSGAVETRLKRVTVYPKSHYVTAPDTIAKIIDTIHEELQSALNKITPRRKISGSATLGTTYFV